MEMLQFTLWLILCVALCVVGLPVAIIVLFMFVTLCVAALTAAGCVAMWLFEKLGGK